MRGWRICSAVAGTGSTASVPKLRTMAPLNEVTLRELSTKPATSTLSSTCTTALDDSTRTPVAPSCRKKNWCGKVKTTTPCVTLRWKAADELGENNRKPFKVTLGTRNGSLGGGTSTSTSSFPMALIFRPAASDRRLKTDARTPRTRTCASRRLAASKPSRCSKATRQGCPPTSSRMPAT